MTEIETAWCAGLFEGEGSIFVAIQKRNGKEYKYCRAVLKMTDFDVVEKFQKLVDCGTIVYQTDECKAREPEHYKRHCYWQLTNRNQLADLMLAFWEHLGERRRAKILEINLLAFDAEMTE